MSRFTGRLKTLVLSGKLARTTLTGAALKVLLVLSAHADRDGLVSMSQRDVADLAGIVRSTVQHAVTELVDADLLWLERAGSGRRPDVYRIITDRHIDAISLGIATRSGPIHLSTTDSGPPVVDSYTGPQEPVVDSYTGPLVGKSPRARTEPGLSVSAESTDARPGKADDEQQAHGEDGLLGLGPRWDRGDSEASSSMCDAEREARSVARLPGEGAQAEVALGLRQEVSRGTSPGTVTRDRHVTGARR